MLKFYAYKNMKLHFWILNKLFQLVSKKKTVNNQKDKER